MKLSSMFVGKLVQGVADKVKPAYEQAHCAEPIGIIRDFMTNFDGGLVVPLVQWVGQSIEYAHCIAPENLKEVE